MVKQRKSLKEWAYENSLSLVLFAIFVATLIGTAAAGYFHENETLQAHGRPVISVTGYIGSGDFYEAVFENWESEFLQMWALVILTIFLRQRGSADSKKLKGREPVDTSSRYSIIRASSWRTRDKAIGHAIYANSLGFALLGIFMVSFAIHAVSGAEAHNQEAQLHGEPSISTGEYLRTSQFWFESFQNWQSEFLAVGVLLVLSIYLRQRGSPESKP